MGSSKKKMANNDELKKSVVNWVNGQPADFYNEEINTLLPHHNKALDIHRG